MPSETAALIQYFRGRWPDEEVPEGEPVWFLYEVNATADSVLRTIEIFADGATIRNSIEIEAANGLSINSLIEGPFMQLVGDHWVEAISKREFENLWERGIDRPFWSAPHNQIPPRS